MRERLGGKPAFETKQAREGVKGQIGGSYMLSVAIPVRYPGQASYVPGSSGRHWVSDHSAPGCAPGVDRTLGGSGSGGCVGCSGGYGGFYCFAVR